MKASASHWGAFKASFNGANLQDMAAFSQDFAPSGLLNSVADLANAPCRIKRAAVRASVLEHGFVKAPKHLRGKEPFVELSIDEASKLVACELKRVYESFGPSAIYGGSYGWHCVGSLNNPPVLLARMLNILGGFTGRMLTYSSHAISVMSPHISGENEATARPSDFSNVLAHSKVILLWSCNLLITNEIAWFVPLHETNKYLKQLKQLIASGQIRVINIDPVYTQTAKYLNAEQIFIKPGTDVALALALCYELVQQNLANMQFLSAYTNGYDKFIAKLQKDKNDAAWAAKITGIEIDKIKELAQLIATNRTMIMAGWGMQRAKNGEQVHRAIINLACMLGQIGLDGGGYGFNYHYSQSGAVALAPNLLPSISAYKANVYSEQIPVSRVVDMLLNPGAEYEFNGQKRTYPKIHCLYSAGGNFLHHHPGRNEQLRALKTLDSLIVQDCFWTASAKFADVVLPANVQTERNDISRSQSAEYVFAMNKLKDSYGDSLSDYEIFCNILKHYDERKLAEFSEGKSHDEWVRGFYEQLRRSSSFELVDYEDFCEQGILKVADASNDEYVRFSDLRSGFRLNTPSGKFELYSEFLGEAKCCAVVDYISEHIDAEYEFKLISQHAYQRLHSQLNNSPEAAKWRTASCEAVLMSKQDASNLGINDGDLIRLISPNGSILSSAKLSDDVMSGVICAFQGAWYSPDEHAECQNGDVNVLISNDSAGRLSCSNQATVNVRVQLVRRRSELVDFTPSAFVMPRIISR